MVLYIQLLLYILFANILLFFNAHLLWTFVSSWIYSNVTPVLADVVLTHKDVNECQLIMTNANIKRSWMYSHINFPLCLADTFLPFLSSILFLLQNGETTADSLGVHIFVIAIFVKKRSPCVLRQYSTLHWQPGLEVSTLGCHLIPDPGFCHSPTSQSTSAGLTETTSDLYFSYTTAKC